MRAWPLTLKLFQARNAKAALNHRFADLINFQFFYDSSSVESSQSADFGEHGQYCPPFFSLLRPLKIIAAPLGPRQLRP
jgi:hypothetical protein